MKRRDFLASTCIAGLASLEQTCQAGSSDNLTRQYYELRHYQINSPANQKRVLNFLTTAAIPALNRIGIKQIGVFKMMESDSSDIYVLLPHNSLESVLKTSSLIVSDPQYNQDSAKFLNATEDDAPYQRIESSLMIAFDSIPVLEIPTSKPSRIFQLRIYESHTELASKKKIEMFNTGGELTIFRKVGMDPVFFGQSLVGSKLPNITYMLGFDDMAAKKKGWDTFRDDPDWKKLKSNPYFKDTVSNITNIMLLPAECSQI